jgi:TPP-dependent pyruvate/acetoin dehydrogenase alpha subunit
MRGPDYNVPADIASGFDAATSLKIFERMSLVRYFELGLMDAVNEERVAYNVYLSTGQEAIAAALSLKIRNYMIFAQHRAHDIYLTFGGDPSKLRDELLGLPSGTSRGRAGSNCLQYHRDGISMYGHHGLIGENVPQAVGAALATARNTVTIFGDGAAEEDYVLSAIGFAATHRLPVYFVCVDNDLSILTPTDVRRSWNITDVAKGFGLEAIDVADDPWAVMHYTERLTGNLPALINCRVCRGYWHVGVGTDGPPQWDRYEMVREQLIRLGCENQIDEIEQKVKRSMERLWDRELSLKPLRK